MTTRDPQPTAMMSGSSASHDETHRTMQVWIDGEWVNQSDAVISVFDHGLLYGDGCFEGIRVYNNRIFKLSSHLRRLFESAEGLHLEPSYTYEQMEEATRETVRRNGIKDGYVRLIFTRGKGTLGLNPFFCHRSSAIVIADDITLYPEEMYIEGMPVIVAKRPRIPRACLDPRIKSLNYLNNILAKVEAIEAGVLEAIMLNIEGDVGECTGDNIFLIKDGVISTPDTSAGMLHGITRRFVIDQIAPAMGYPVVERRHTIDEFMEADEIFLTGTAAEVIGVRSIDEVPVGCGKVGPITASLIKEFRRCVCENAPED